MFFEAKDFLSKTQNANKALEFRLQGQDDLVPWDNMVATFFHFSLFTFHHIGLLVEKDCKFHLF